MFGGQGVRCHRHRRRGEHVGEKSGDPSYHGALRENVGGLGLNFGIRVEKWREIGNHGVFSQQEEEHEARTTAQRDADPGG